MSQKQPRRYIIVLLALSVSFTAGCSQDISKTRKVGEQAPDFSLKGLTGERVTLKDLKQTGIVMVNFWATWCAPCKAEVPILNQIYEKYQSQGLTVVGISVEEKKDMVAAFCKRNNVQYPVLLDSDGSVAKQYGVFAVPKTLILNQRGTVLLQHSQIVDEGMIMDLEAVLDKGQPAGQSGDR